MGADRVLADVPLYQRLGARNTMEWMLVLFDLLLLVHFQIGSLNDGD